MEVKRLKYVNTTWVMHGIKIVHYHHFTEEGKSNNNIDLKDTKIFSQFGYLQIGVIYEIEYASGRAFSIADSKQKVLVKGNRFVTIDLATGVKRLPSKNERKYWEAFLKTGGDINNKNELL